jgi:hypothetical protein
MVTVSTNKRERNDPKPFRSSDTRVIISAYRLEKISDDHPYNAEFVRA